MDCKNTAQTSERDILTNFYKSLNGDKWLNSFNWGSGSGVCTWFGVTCNADLSVLELKLPSNQIYSTVDQLDVVGRIFELPNLQVLDFKGNSMYIDFQRIPITSSLQSLRVSGTGLTSLAGISGASNLVRLHATDNLLNGTIPDEIFELPNLKSLYLSFNALEGSIPAKISQLSNLEELYMYGNMLSRNLPSEIGLLQNLREVVLAKNFFTGAIPTQFNSLPKLEQLSLYDQQGVDVISGNVPTFAQAPNLW
jgi:Leucine-rich repeat (LRR) protein